MLGAVHPTLPDSATFAVAAAVIIGGAIGVISARNAVHAALSLVMTLFGVAVLFIEEQADFLAVVQIIVYAGAIVVLFLFVIMFLGVDRREDVAFEPLRGQRPLALLLVAVVLGGVLALGVSAHWATGAHAVAGPRTAGGHSNVYALGKAVFTTYLFAFEATAGLLVIAVVGAVVLARRPRMDGTEGGLELPAEEPDGEPADSAEAPGDDGSAAVPPHDPVEEKVEEEVSR
jgi:NADH-quinone oxidoreductase subunit J